MDPYHWWKQEAETEQDGDLTSGTFKEIGTSDDLAPLPPASPPASPLLSTQQRHDTLILAPAHATAASKGRILTWKSAALRTFGFSGQIVFSGRFPRESSSRKQKLEAGVFWSFVADCTLSIWCRFVNVRQEVWVAFGRCTLESRPLQVKQSAAHGDLAIIFGDSVHLYDGSTAAKLCSVHIPSQEAKCMEWMPNTESLLIATSGESPGEGYVHVLNRPSRGNKGTLTRLYISADGPVLEMKCGASECGGTRAMVAVLRFDLRIQVARWICEANYGEAFEVLYFLHLPLSMSFGLVSSFDWTHDFAGLVVIRGGVLGVWGRAMITPVFSLPSFPGTVCRTEDQSYVVSTNGSRVSIMNIFSGTVK